MHIVTEHMQHQDNAAPFTLWLSGHLRGGAKRSRIDRVAPSAPDDNDTGAVALPPSHAGEPRTTSTLSNGSDATRIRKRPASTYFDDCSSLHTHCNTNQFQQEMNLARDESPQDLNFQQTSQTLSRRPASRQRLNVDRLGEEQSADELSEQVNHTNRELQPTAPSLQSSITDQVNLARGELAQNLTPSSNKKQWHLKFQSLHAWMDAHDHKIPKRTSVDPVERSLAQWVNDQRKSYQGGQRRALQSYQTTLLESIPGWTWEAHNWDSTWCALRDWLEEHNRQYPKRNANNHAERSLAQWINDQRKSYNHKQLQTSQELKLESLLGWSWGTRTLLRRPVFGRFILRRPLSCPQFNSDMPNETQSATELPQEVNHTNREH